MPIETLTDPEDNFSNMGKTYQEKVVSSLLVDHDYAEQMADVLNPKYFDLRYLQEIVGGLYSYKQKFKTYPSPDVLEIMLTREDRSDELLNGQVREYLARTKASPLNGDTGYVQSTSLEFCKKQLLKEAILNVIDKIKDRDYDSIQTVIREALNKGGTRDVGHDYIEGFGSRGDRASRQPISTGWAVVDRELNGGWERQTLTTFIAPTGAGKTMFLCNVGAGGIANGLNVIYITCEMADYKIGLRFDSYFSGVEINSIVGKQEQVESDVRSKVKGRLFIKEFPTKTASVQTIRSYVQRLRATKNFIPDMIIVDYADLLRGTRSMGEKRYELEAVYEELRAMAQELNVVLITADQTNRSGLDMEIVTIGQIGESYSKATVCDLIFTISRRMEDKQANCGRLFFAKSRLGRDGMVYPFVMNPATVKVSILEQHEDPIAIGLNDAETLKKKMSERWNRLMPSSSTR